MQPGSKFCLGSAILGAEPAEGYAAATEPVPDAWLLLFLNEHVGTSVAAGFFSSCRAGRDLILQRHDSVRLNIDCTAAMQPAQREQQLSVLRDVLRVRETDTDLKVICNNTRQCTQVLMSVPGALQGAAQHIDFVQLSCLDYRQAPSTYHVVEFLTAAAAAFPALRRLWLDDVIGPLPLPEQLPRLQWLTVHWGQPGANQSAAIGRLSDSIRSHLPTLHSLSIRFSVTAPFSWQRLLSPENPAAHLKRLTAHTALTDELCGLILNHAPALEYLSVASIQIFKPDSWAQRQWGLKELSLAQDFTATALLGLPQSSATEPLKVTGSDVSVSLPLTASEGIDATLIAALPRWHFATKKFTIALPEPTAPAAQDAAAHAAHAPSADAAQRATSLLRTALGQVGAIQAADPRVRVVAGKWPAELLQVVAQAISSVPHITFEIKSNTPLTDELLSGILEHCPGLKALGVPRLALQSNTHTNTPWPWDELTIDTLDVADLCKLPKPEGAAECVFSDKPLEELVLVDATGYKRLLCRSATISARVHEVGVAGVCERLQGLGLGHPEEGTGVIFNIPYAGPSLDAMAAQMSTFQSFILSGPLTELQVELKGWEMTHAAMHALKRLPPLPAWLDITDCTWPLQPAEYVELAQCLPTSYQEWWVSAKDGSALLECICAGLIVRRKGVKGLKGPQKVAVPEYDKADRHVGGCACVTKQFFRED